MRRKTRAFFVLLLAAALGLWAAEPVPASPAPATGPAPEANAGPADGDSLPAAEPPVQKIILDAAAYRPAPHSFFVTGGPLLLVNTDSGSAPSPIVFSCGLGASLFQTSAVTFQSRLSFFTNYYLWDTGADCARPAEIENRTALVLSALWDLCALKTWYAASNQFQLGGGAGLLMRLAALAQGVSSGDSGAADGRTAGDDVKDIQSWLWSGCRWLYPEVVFSWLHALPGVTSRRGFSMGAGLEARFYLPLGSLLAGEGLDAALASLAFKLQF